MVDKRREPEVWPGAFDLHGPVEADKRQAAEQARRERIEAAKRAAGLPVPQSTGVQVIEQTSKRWKWLQLSGCLLSLACLVVLMVIGGLISRGQTGEVAFYVMSATVWVCAIGFLVGIARWIYGWVGAWWHHG